MAYDMVKYERGQVWKIIFKNPDAVGREQTRDRPWLILSINKFNHTSGMFTAVPITTRDRIVSPAQVLFTNVNNQKNVILCEQIRSFDYRSGEYITEYLGVLSNEVLEKVDVALSVHQGLHYSPVTLKSLYETMEAIVKSVGYMQEKANTPKFTNDDVKEFTEKLMSLAGQSMNLQDFSNAVNDDVKSDTEDHRNSNFHEEVKNSKWEPNFYKSPEESKPGRRPPFYMESNNVEDDTTEEESAVVDHPKKEMTHADKDEKGNVVLETVKPKRMKWTQQKMKEFNDDATKLPLDEVMKKWGIANRARFYSMKQYVKNNLQK